MINTEQLAEELHKFYRAAAKALSTGRIADGTRHDHGWDHCNKKKYFLRRAQQLAETLKKDLYMVSFGGTHIDPYPAKLHTPKITKVGHHRKSHDGPCEPGCYYETTKEGLGHVGQD